MEERQDWKETLLATSIPATPYTRKQSASTTVLLRYSENG